MGCIPGDMGDPSKNIYNPLFYAHHGLIDYLAAQYIALKNPPDAADFNTLSASAQQAMETPSTSLSLSAMSGCSAHRYLAANPNAQSRPHQFWKALAALQAKH